MDLAEKLGMTLGQLLGTMTSQELTLWIARATLEAEAQRMSALGARAEALAAR
jgi:hypothetical protein